MSKLVFGVGINDAGYCVESAAQGWICPFYRKWKDMLKRCYSAKYLLTRPTYSGSSVVPEWHRFSVFRAWMEEQDWEGKQLDKDLLVLGNNTYSPETCTFITPQLNTFLAFKRKGVKLPGSTWNRKAECFYAQISVAGHRKILGKYPDAITAHFAWVSAKLSQLEGLLPLERDSRITYDVVAAHIRAAYTNEVPPQAKTQGEER